MFGVPGDLRGSSAAALRPQHVPGLPGKPDRSQHGDSLPLPKLQEMLRPMYWDRQELRTDHYCRRLPGDQEEEGWPLFNLTISEVSPSLMIPCASGWSRQTRLLRLLPRPAEASGENVLEM